MMSLLASLGIELTLGSALGLGLSFFNSSQARMAIRLAMRAAGDKRKLTNKDKEYLEKYKARRELNPFDDWP